MALRKYILKEVSEGKRKALNIELMKMLTKIKNFPPDALKELEESFFDSYFFRYQMDFILGLDSTPNNQLTLWLMRVGLPTAGYLKSWQLNEWEKDLYNLLDNHGLTKNASKDFKALDFRRLEEDADRFREYLGTYFNVKQRKDFPQQYKDINAFKSWDEFINVMKPYVFDPDGASFEEILGRVEEGKDYVTLYEDAQWGLYQPETEEGACALGSKSEWCTAWGPKSYNNKFKGRTNQFNSYKKEGELNTIISIHDKGNDEYYQIDLKSHSYMDASDRSVRMLPIFNRFSEGALSVLYKFVSTYIEDEKDDLEIDSIESIREIYPDSFSPIFEKIIDEYYRGYLTNTNYINLVNGEYYARFDDLTEFAGKYCKTEYIEDSYDYSNGLYSDHDLSSYESDMTEETLKEILKIVIASDEYEEYKSNMDEDEFEEPTIKNIIDIISENDEFENYKDVISWAIDEVLNDDLVNDINDKIIKGSLELMGHRVPNISNLFGTLLKWDNGDTILVNLDIKEGEPLSEIFINFCKQIIDSTEGVDKFNVGTNYMYGSIDEDNVDYLNERILDRLDSI